MDGKLRHGKAFEAVHFAGLVDLLLQLGPLPSDFLASGADLFRGCLLDFICFG